MAELNDSILVTSEISMLDQKSGSPVTINAEWSRVGRLLVMSTLTILGSIGNVYMISAIIVEEHLSRRGNTYVANVALADLVISGVVVLASAVVLLAGLDDCPPVCTIQWFLGLLCGLVTLFSMVAVAVENYARLCLSPSCYAKLTTGRITWSVFIIWGVSLALVCVHFIYRIGPDYCKKRIIHNKPYQLLIFAAFVIIPILITFILYIRILLNVRAVRAKPSFKPPLPFVWDYSLMLTNFYSFIMFIVFWAPFAVIMVMSSIDIVSSKTFYGLAWFALSKSCFNCFLYCISNGHFCDAYVKLFHYCCCKTTVTFSRRPRSDGARPSGDVRVHIIPGYNVYPYTSPQRSGMGSGECVKKSNAGGGKRAFRHIGGGRTRSADREVYQL